jgi:hypothetical protein
MSKTGQWIMDLEEKLANERGMLEYIDADAIEEGVGEMWNEFWDKFFKSTFN